MRKVGSLKGVGKATEQIFNDYGIYTIDDLLYYYPKKYESFVEDSLLFAVDKTVVTTRGIVASTPIVINHRGNLKSLQFKLLVDHELYKIIAFRREFLKDSLKEDMVVQVKGRFEKKRKTITASLVNLKPIESDLKAVYGFEGIYDSNVSKIVRNIFSTHQANIYETLPERIIRKRNLLDHYDMIYNLHFPRSKGILEEAIQRLKFEEALAFQIRLMEEKLKSDRIKKEAKDYDLEIVKSFIETIPYELTQDQKDAVNDIFRDFKKPYPVKRLIQGDVGSGKTVVVAIAIMGAKTAGMQSALMAPTEVLAQQHYELFKTNFKQLKTALLTSSTKNKKALKEQIKNGEIDLVIGTHALITDDTDFFNLGYVVIDEQHRFGVAAREVLETKGIADVCYLTATPIPRTLAIVIFGDMELSNIYEKPKGRKPVITKHFTHDQQESIFTHVKKELEKGNQAYFVAPSIESDFRGESVIGLYEKITEVFNNPIFMLHGRMSGQEKQEVMENFNNTPGSILVSTTVIEVGLDVKNATMMVIFDGKYFGLSQLHQLRGRVGRAEQQSYCYVISDTIDIERLEVFQKTNDGFLLADYDLSNRGPGEFLGVKQSGMISFTHVDIIEDYNMLLEAKTDALEILKNKEECDFYRINNKPKI